MRRGLRLTPWMCSSEPGTRVAASTNGAAEEKSPGIVDLAQRQPLCGSDRDARRPDRDGRTRPGKHPLRVVAGRGGLDDGGLAVRVQAGEQEARLHLRARHGQHVVDRVERPALDPQRQPAVARLDAGAHPYQRLGDAAHRAGAQGLVAGELELLPLLAGEDARQQPYERARVGAVDRLAGGGEPAEPDTVDAELVVADLVDRHPECSHRSHGRLGVGRAPEAGDARLAVADAADQRGAVRDRLVARDRDVTDEAGDGLDGDRNSSLRGQPLRGASRFVAHSSITGDATTP